MILPKKGETPKATVELGTAYDINKQLISKYEKEITSDDYNNLSDKFIEYIDTNIDNYFMLLCNEEKDYTIFHLPDDEKVIDAENKAFKELKECLFNRGKLYGFDITEDKQAIEIWIKKENGMHCYYFFSYGNAVIEC